MAGDIFGNLEDWGRVVEQLDRLTREGALDPHQPGLVRLLRFEGNWRLREAALEAARHVREPAEALVAEVLRRMMDESLYYEARAPAAEALAALVAAGRRAPGQRHRALEARVLEQMHALLDGPGPPVLHQAVRRVLPTIE